MGCVGPEGAQLLIDHDKYIIELVFNGLFGSPKYSQDLSPEKRARLEGLRVTIGKGVLPVMGMVRTFASRFPEEAVRDKVTPEWLVKRGEKAFPEIVEVWRGNGDKGYAWLSRQADEITAYCTGKLVWDKDRGEMVDLRKRS